MRASTASGGKLIGRLAALLLALAAPAIAAAQAPAAAPGEGELWTHPASGATLPRRFGDQSITGIQDIDNRWNSVIVYSGDGGGVESITVFIFRAALPDARLWFDRALPSVARAIPLAIFEAGPDTPFSAFGAAAPNGLYRIYRTDRPGPFRTTALAVAQAGEWLVKIRYSSASLDGEAMAARIAALAAAIRFPDPIVPAALSAPVADCTRPPVDGTGRPAEANEQNLAVGTIGGLLLVPRIRQPLAGGAGDWCRDAGFLPGQATLLRLIDDPHNWVLLLGDAGQAVVSVNGERLGMPGERRSAVYVVAPAFFRVAALFHGSPPIMTAMVAAVPVLDGRSEGLLELGPERDDEQP